MTQIEGEKHLMKATLTGTVWVYLANYSGKFLVFLSTIVLARLLTKADFGLAGYALVVISFLDVINDLGVGPALIYYKDEPDTRDTGFWLGMLAGIGLFALTYVGAPLVGMFFNEPKAIPLTRALALTFPFTALGNVHASLLSKSLSFKRKFIPDLSKAAGKGILSILLAWMGFGEWSLVLGQVGGTAIGSLVYWLVTPWRPRLRFLKSAARPLLTFGANIMLVDSMGVIFTDVDYLFVGRFLGPEALGVYVLAFRIPELLVKNFCNVVSYVLFPAYTRIRDDSEKLNRGFLISMRSITVITVPISLGLAVLARPMALTLFTSKWVDAVPVLSAISIYTLIRSLTFNIGSIYKAKGRPDILTRLAVLKLPVVLPALYWAVTGPGTITAVGWVQVFVATIAGIMNLVAASWVLGMPMKDILASLWPSAVGGGIMVAAVMVVLAPLQSAAPIIQLILGVLVGGIVYIAAMWLLQREFILQISSSLRLAFARRAAVQAGVKSET